MMRKLLYSFLFFISSKSLSKKSCTPSLGLLCVGMFFVVSFAYADTYYSRTSGNANNRNNWGINTNGTGAAPANFANAGDVFIIRNGNAMTTNGSWTVAGALTINSGGSLAISNTTILGSFNINNGGTASIQNDFTVTTATNITGTISFGSANTTSRTITFTGSVTLNSGAVWNETTSGAAASFSFGNDFTNNATTFNAQNPTHSFTGVNRVLNGNTTTTISNVSITGSYANNINILTVSSALSGSGTLTNSSGKLINIGGTSTIANLVATAAGNSVNYNGSGNQNIKTTDYHNLTISGSGSKTAVGSLTVSNNFTLSSATFVANNATSFTHSFGNYIQNSGVFDFNAGTSGVSNVNISGNFTNTAGASSITTVGFVQNGIFNFNGSAVQTLNMPTDAAAIWVKYNVNAGSTLKLASDFTLNTALSSDGDAWMGEINVNGTIDLGTYRILPSGGRGSTSGTAKFLLNSGGTLITANANGVDGSVPVAATMARTCSSAANYTFNGTVAQVTSTGLPSTVNNLIISNTHSSGVTLSQATTASGNITIGASSTLDVSSSNFAVNVGGNFTSSGTFTPRSGTVTLNGTNQSFNIPNFNNLTLSGSGTKSFAATTAVSNALVINSTVNANLGNGQTHTANTLTLGATEVLPTTWGNTISPSVSKNDTYFTATTGIVRVANSACTNFSLVAPITRVSLNTLSHPTTAMTSYENIEKTAATTTLNKGDFYSLVINGNTNGDHNMFYTAFFDWNGDGSFGSDEGPIQLGTIRNSSGSDGKATSRYFQIPATATGTDIKMRIIGLRGAYNSTSCTVNTGIGQVEDYVVTLLSGCVGPLPSSVTTNSTLAAVCPYEPFTLSLGGSEFGDGAIYTWQTSPNLTGPWTSAARPTIDFYRNDFSTPQGINSNPADGTSLRGEDTEIKGGELVLTDIAAGGHNGGFFINKSNANNINAFNVDFKYRIWDGGTIGADGLSLSYGPNFAANAGGGEGGEGSGLVVQFDTYDNEGVETGSRVRIVYNNASIFNAAINAPFNLRTSVMRDVKLKVDSNGILSLAIQNVSGDLVTVVSKLVLPNYTSTVKSTWKFKFSARTGGSKDKHSIDDLAITFLDSENSKSKFTTSETTRTYYRAVITCGGSSVESTPVLVDVISATISPMTHNVCTGALFTVVPVNGTNGTIPANTTYTWTAPLVTGGMTGGAANTVAASNITGTLTNSTATAQTATYTVTPITGTCTGIPFVLTVTVNPLPAEPILTKDSDVICGSLGRVTLTGLPSGSWTINQTGEVIDSYTGTDSSYEITDLVGGNYSFTVTNDLGCTSTTVSTIINNNAVTTTWNGSLWTNGNPDGNKTVRVISVSPNQPFTNSTPTVPVNLTVCSLEIAVPGPGQVTIPSNMTLTVTSGITSDGNLVFESGSSLLQDESAVNSGNVSYKRKVDLSRYDVVYWGTPLVKADFKMRDFSPYTLWDKFHYWDNVNSTWILSDFGEEVMRVGEGYSIRAPQYFDLTAKSTFEGVFVGVPYNGDKTVQVVPNKLNLIGNPYPSAVNARKLIEENANHIGALYFWTHALAPERIPGTNIFRYLSADFVVFTLAGSTRVTGEAVTGTEEFDEFIATGQAFFTRTPPTASEIKFNNGLRMGSSYNTQFYKTAETDKTEKNRLWLNVTNSKGAFKQLLIAYMDGATNGIDLAYDATSMNANANVDFYTINEGKKLTIQGRALPFDNTEIIPLGFKCGIDDSADRDFTFSLDHADGFFDTQEVYLEDKILGKVIDLRKENYTFTSAKGTYSTRFVLRYTNKTLGTGDFENLENSVLVSVKDKAVKITSSKETLKEVNIYNVGAQLLYSNDKVNASELQITNLHSSDQVILVQITLENGHTFNKKVIFSNL